MRRRYTHILMVFRISFFALGEGTRVACTSLESESRATVTLSFPGRRTIGLSLLGSVITMGLTFTPTSAAVVPGQGTSGPIGELYNTIATPTSFTSVPPTPRPWIPAVCPPRLYDALTIPRPHHVKVALPARTQTTAFCSWSHVSRHDVLGRCCCPHLADEL